MRLPLLAVLLPSLSLLTACPGDPCARAATVDPLLRLGVGEKDFTELADGDAVTYASGGQGGQHVWTALEAEGIHPGVRGFLTADEETPTIELSLTGEVDGTELGFFRTEYQAFDGDVQLAVLTGLTLFIDNYGSYYDTTEDTEVEQDYRMYARVEDVCGTVLEAEHVVVVPG